MEKKLSEMNDRELFGVLCGNQGVMAQMYLRKAVIAYRSRHNGQGAPLSVIVREYLSCFCMEEMRKSA
jgi:hypothetical protein